MGFQEKMLEVGEALDKVMGANNLMLDFDANPPYIRARITRKKEALPLFGNCEEEQAMIEFTFAEEVNISMIGAMDIDDETFSKLRSLLKKYHYIYLENWYATKDDRYERMSKEVWETAKGDSVVIISKGFRP